MYPTIAYDVNAEAALLSCFINDIELFGKYINRLKPDIFYRKRNSVIFKSMKELHSENKPIDLVSLRNHIDSNSEIDKSDINEYLNELGDMIQCPIENNLKEYIAIVVGKYQIRQKERMAYQIIETSKRPVDYQEIKKILFSNNVLSIDDVTESSVIVESLHQIIKNVNAESIECIEKGVKRINGLNSGFRILDKFVKFRPQNTYCIASRPGMGKSSISLKMALNNIMEDYKVLFISLEMSKEELMEKLISFTQRITNDEFRALHESEQIIRRNELSEFLGYKSNNLIIDDNSVEIHEIKNSIYNEHRTNKIDLVVIDYLQLITIDGSTENRNQEITKISRMIKSEISKKLQIPVIVLSQLNRGVEQRDNKRPVLSDLRDSGSIEQDMSFVMFIYRDEEYGIFLDKRTGKSTEGVAELHIAKNRFGSKGLIKMKFEKNYALFE